MTRPISLANSLRHVQTFLVSIIKNFFFQPGMQILNFEVGLFNDDMKLQCQELQINLHETRIA